MNIPCRPSATYFVRATVIIIFVVGLLFSPCLFAGEWREATTPRPWSFPRDHGSHPEYRTEWWYFTGNLNDNGGKRYGYQLTFFRYGLALQPKQPSNAWSVRDIYLAHFAITDVSRDTFHYTDRVSRAGPGLASAKGTGMEVRVLSWSAAMEGKRINLRAAHGGMELALRLTPTKPVVLHGNRGLSKKGPGSGILLLFLYESQDRRIPQDPEYDGPRGSSRHELVRPGVRLQPDGKRKCGLGLVRAASE